MDPAVPPFVSLRRLSYWLAIVDEGSFTAAAGRLSISQPALSHQIRALERELGGELLERLPNGTRPTPAGRAVLPEARAALAGAQRVASTARQALRLEAGTLEIATFPSLATGSLLDPIRRWYQRHPAISIRLSEFRDRMTLERAVRDGIADLGIGSRPTNWSGPQQTVGWNEFLAVLPAHDPLIDHKGPLALNALGDREWVLYDRAYGLTDLVIAACAHAGFQPRGVIETSQAEAAGRLAAAGLGPALVPAANVPDDIASFARRLSPPLSWEICAFTRTAWSPAAAAYLRILSENRKPPVPPRNAIALEVQPS